MAYNEILANRVREMISVSEKQVEEKKMFGGLCFMVNNKMCVGVESTRLMVRFNPLLTDEVMEKEGASPMDFTKKIMKGYAFVSMDAVATQKGLKYWIDLALDFNKIAKSSKKKP